MNSTSENNLLFWQQAYEIQKQMNDQLTNITFCESIYYVYNPTIYAVDLYKKFLMKFLNGPKKTLLIGINPAPWGMCQTGIAFSSPKIVREKLGLEGIVQQPERMHPKKPVTGLECTKYDPSGKRLWGLFDQFYRDSDTLFNDNFILNYCPLAFFKRNSGEYLNLSKLEVQTRNAIKNICNDGLKKLIELIKPSTIICIGTDSKDRVKFIQEKNPTITSFTLICMKHPSPTTRVSEYDWSEGAKQLLINHGWTLLDNK